MFEKKLKVRISHFGRDYYTVDYTYYRFIPWYNSIMYWFDQGPTGGTEGWSTDLFKLKDAETFASSLKSIEDVNEYYRKEHIKRSEFYKRKNDYYNTNVPYKSKQIL